MSILRPMTEPEFQQFLEESVVDYAADKVTAGQWAQADSLELSRKSFHDLLPQGLATPDNFLFNIVDDAPNASGASMGVLWIAVQTRANQRVAYVYDVSVRPAYQRKGYATRAFVALEERVRELGLAGIALHVFGHNAGAQALYVKLGYATTNINMYKALGPATSPSPVSSLPV